VIQLAIWHPPTFALSLFSVFPPATALILHLLVPHAPLAAAVCAAVVGYSAERVGGMWERRGRDREVLGGEVLREYDQRVRHPPIIFHSRADAALSPLTLTALASRLIVSRQFVYPNLFKQRKEVGVMTHEAEMVW